MIKNVSNLLKKIIFFGIEDDQSQKKPTDDQSEKAEAKNLDARKKRDVSVLQGADVPRYPPFKTGLPLVSPESLVESQKELIAKIRDSLGLSIDEHQVLIEPLIIRFAEFVHLLPASETHHHRGAGGLFRHSLEAGAWAAQFADSKIFSFGKTPLERKKEEPRWVVATFVAALIHDIGKSATDMAIISDDGHSEWNPYLGTLWEWGVENNVNRYFVRWREARHKKHEQTGLLLADQILTKEIKSWLGEVNSEIISSMLQASTCQGDDAISELVKRSDSTSVNHDLKTNTGSSDDLSVGVPVERHILDACRRLIKSNKWTINKKGSRVWVTAEGVFIVWRSGGSDEIVELLTEDKVPGIPRDPDTLADLLIERNLAQSDTQRNEGHVNRYWEISPSVLDGIFLNCLKIPQLETLFSSEPPIPLQVLIKENHGVERLVEGYSPPIGSNPTKEDSANEKKVEAKKPTVANIPKKNQSSPSLVSKESAASPEQTRSPEPTLAVPKPAPERSDSRALKKEEKPPVAPKETPGQLARAWFENQRSPAAKLILKIFRDIELNIYQKSNLFGVEGTVSYLKYPDPIRPYGKPSDIIQMLMDEDWIIPDPVNENKKARDMGDSKGLVFPIEISEKIIAMITYGIGEVTISKESPKASFSDQLASVDTKRQVMRPDSNLDEPKPKKLFTSNPTNKQSNKTAPSNPETSQANSNGEKPKTKPDNSSQNAVNSPKTEQKASNTNQAPASTKANIKQVIQSSDPEVPPRVIKSVKDEVAEVAGNFMVEVRLGKIEGSTNKHKEHGHICLVVGMSRLIRFGRPFSGGELRTACEQRKDCFLEGNSIWVVLDPEQQ